MDVQPAPRPSSFFQDDFLSRITSVAVGHIQAVRTPNSERIADHVSSHLGARSDRRLIFMPIGPVCSISEALDLITTRLARLALCSWPVWFGDCDFGWFKDDALGGQQLRRSVRDLVAADRRISERWVTLAVQQAARGREPRVVATPELELRQLLLTLSRAGVIVIVPFPSQYDPQRARIAVELVEWVARNGPASVVPLIPAHWPDEAPVDRLLFTAISARLSMVRDEPSVSRARDYASGSDNFTAFPERSEPSINAIRGLPHPLSDVEKRVWKYLTEDAELADLFCCNQNVRTIHGNSPRVDLLWNDGRIVVELDGFSDHGARDAFERDRHRDYELTLSGYHVLRITNDEVNRDLEAAIGKIRDVVRLQRINSRETE